MSCLVVVRFTPELVFVFVFVQTCGCVVCSVLLCVSDDVLILLDFVMLRCFAVAGVDCDAYCMFDV